MRALISVYDKSGIAEFAQKLAALQVELVSSGGTATELRKAGLDVTEVSDLTGFPEMLDGRVKTLHPAIHAGILAIRDKPDHMETLETHGIQPIDIVICNLYAFQSNPSIELIDVGGPSLIRAAAKNHSSVTVLVDPNDYEPVLGELRLYGQVTDQTRRRLAEVAFWHTAVYDAQIAAWLNQANQKLFPNQLALPLKRSLDLRYGENPHQQAAFYTIERPAVEYASLAAADLVHGPELSFNNLLDIDAAVNAACSFGEPTAAIIKHNNPCGLAVRTTLSEAFQQAEAGDPVSAYGGVLAVNRPLDAVTVEAIGKLFLEVIVAPDFETAALERLRRRTKTRLVRLSGDWTKEPSPYQDLDFRRIRGGFLVQTLDFDAPNLGFQVVSRRQPTPQQVEDLKFAWRVVRHVKSNAIVLATERSLIGVGAGQMSRVESVEIAVRKAGTRAQDSVLASDAFFPFPDGVELAVKAGVKALIQPGGSIRDKEAIAAANAGDAVMVFTGERHFRH